MLFGDMFYDPDFRDDIVHWATEQRKRHGTEVYVGDPGRLPLMESSIRQRLTNVATYDLTESCKADNNGLTKGYVWKLT